MALSSLQVDFLHQAMVEVFLKDQSRLKLLTPYASNFQYLGRTRMGRYLLSFKYKILYLQYLSHHHSIWVYQTSSELFFLIFVPTKTRRIKTLPSLSIFKNSKAIVYYGCNITKLKSWNWKIGRCDQSKSCLSKTQKNLFT